MGMKNARLRLSDLNELRASSTECCGDYINNCADPSFLTLWTEVLTHRCGLIEDRAYEETQCSGVVSHTNVVFLFRLWTGVSNDC
jgi:hypothetical protein